VGLRRKPAKGHAGTSDPLRRERYFTDGSNLYRFLEFLTSSGTAKLAALEDCRTLGLLLVSADYLSKAGLRPVP
jgi:hypothetical protein